MLVCILSLIVRSYIYPQCQSEPAVVTQMNEKAPLELKCISAKANPAVELRWIDNLNQGISSQNVIQGNTVSSEITLHNSTRYGSLFNCEMASPTFPDFKRTCQVGPVTIKTKMTPGKTAVIQTNMPVGPYETNNQYALTLNECNTKCSFEDKKTI